MSLEQHLEALTITVAALTAATQQLTQTMMTATVSLPVPQHASLAVPATVAPAPVPVAAAMPPAPFAAPAAAPAALPAFMQAPAPAAAPAALPFNDIPSLLKYAGDVYQAVEAKSPGSGARINEVMAACGLTNMNDATAAHFPNLYAGLEALKAG